MSKELKDTVKLMSSADYKDRFRGEYEQLSIRIAKLDEMLRDMRHKKLNFEPKCSYELLMSQLNLMYAYKCLLEERARIEGINLYQ